MFQECVCSKQMRVMGEKLRGANGAKREPHRRTQRRTQTFWMTGFSKTHESQGTGGKSKQRHDER